MHHDNTLLNSSIVFSSLDICHHSPLPTEIIKLLCVAFMSPTVSSFFSSLKFHYIPLISLTHPGVQLALLQHAWNLEAFLPLVMLC